MSVKYNINQTYLKNFKEFTLNIKSYFAQNNQTIHKARNELKIINHNDISTVVKAFKVPNIINQIAYSFFRDSKAKKSYMYSLKIKNFTPEPISYIEFYQYGLLKESFFISQKFDYDFTIREPLLNANFKGREEIFKAFSRFTLELHNNNIFHNDYSPGNILIKKDTNGYIFKIVDINRMKFFTLSQEDRAKNFSKLWADDDILKIMATEYLKHFDSSIDFIPQVLYFSNKNKKMKNFKKKMKNKL